jgi:hypothetical protein
VAKVHEEDPLREQLAIVLEQWRQTLGLSSAYTVQDVIGRAVNDPPFYNALLAVAGNQPGTMISNDRLGRWLKRVHEKIIGGFKLVHIGRINGYPRWKLFNG